MVPSSEKEEAQIDPGKVFKANIDSKDAVKMQTMSWPVAFALMFKVHFSLGILSLPAVMAPVGAVQGALLIIGWSAYDIMALICGAIVWGLVGTLSSNGYIPVTGSGYRAGAVAFNGDFGLGFSAVGKNSSFLTGLSASTVIFISLSDHSTSIPIIAEMRNPKDYKKPLALVSILLNLSYLVFGLVIYHYCGQYIASLSLGDAGDLIKKHLTCGYLFVHLLRNSDHLQRKPGTHWVTWLAVCISVGIAAFVIAEVIPRFSTVPSFVSTMSFTLLAIICPATLFVFDYQKSYVRWLILKEPPTSSSR
ncbi:hypothetical protein JCM8547_003591 [Rhodosporidiobolus lusitaniae]